MPIIYRGPPGAAVFPAQRLGSVSNNAKREDRNDERVGGGRLAVDIYGS